MEGHCALAKTRDTIPPASRCRNPPPGKYRESSPDSKIFWQSWRRDLNPRPSDYKSDALPTELRQHGSNRENITKGHVNCKGLCERLGKRHIFIFWTVVAGLFIIHLSGYLEGQTFVRRMGPNPSYFANACRKGDRTGVTNVPNA